MSKSDKAVLAANVIVTILLVVAVMGLATTQRGQMGWLHDDISAVMDTQDDDGVEVRDRIMELQDQIDSLRGDMDALAEVVWPIQQATCDHEFMKQTEDGLLECGYCVKCGAPNPNLVRTGGDWQEYRDGMVYFHYDDPVRWERPDSLQVRGPNGEEDDR